MARLIKKRSSKAAPSALSRGFTVMELVIVLVVSSVLVISVTPFFRANIQAYMVARAQKEMLQQSRIGFNRMMSEIRRIGQFCLLDLSSQRLEFLGRNETGGLTPAITYSYSSTKGQILRNNGTGAVRLIEGVSAFTITGYTRTGATTSTEINVWRIRISMTLGADTQTCTLVEEDISHGHGSNVLIKGCGMKQKSFLREEAGFWSAFFFLFIVTLGLLGMGAYSLMKSEGINVANEMKSLQAKNSLEAGALYGLSAMRRSLFTYTVEHTALTIGGANVSLDTSKSGSDLVLRVTATNGNASRQLQVQFQIGHQFSDNAIATTGTVSNVTVLDSLRNVDPERLVQSEDSIPTFKIDSLKAMALAQGHKKVGNWAATANYPSASFYKSGSTPNVTHITGNLTIAAEKIYGIFIVEGTVTITGTGRIYGVLYLPNVSSTIIKSSTVSGESAVEGGIISHGDITGKVANITVEHNKTYMNIFNHFRKYGEVVNNKLVRWIYT